ncbi:spike base protein, RCAP_Rcc01079 family [Rhizobium leguminosarum]
MAAANPISKSSTAWLGPASGAVAITPDATATFMPTRGIMCSGAGTIAAKFSDTAADVSLTLTAGVVYPFSIVAVRIAGTSATGLVAFY